MQKQNQDIIVFDAKDKILGRLASTAAKSLLQGKSVAVINAENAVISGNKHTIAARYRTRLNLQEKANPEHSPYWSRRPDMLVKRIIRGMLPYNRPKGKSAYRRLKVYIGVPDELRSAKPIEIKTKEPKKLYVGHVKVGDLSTLLGYTRK
ncbi:MAG: 50S ribosomal protein L13 [Candidatus Micrarchaeota archaeon]|nr:50S ribosomal protein L13 [Candidatus Micrarchaeota archaeon]